MRIRCILATMALGLILSAPAHALMFGIRYSDIREHRLPPLIDDTGKNRFGVYTGIGQGSSVFLLGADYDRSKIERGDSLMYFRRFTVNLGYRYNLLSNDKASAMNFMPFLAIHYFKSFSKVDADSTLLSKTDASYYNDILNDNGGWISVGAEYFFARVFSLGAEGGLRYSRTKSSAYGYSIKSSEYTSFGAILINFYW